MTIAPQTSVLVVDDVPENRDLLVRRLMRLGIKDIAQATNGKEALVAIGQKAFDLVLLDIMMPEMDGFEVLAALKADGRINDLPVVVISALSEIEPVVRCIELGAEDFIFKPFNPTLLRARVTSSLEKKALQDAQREELRRKQAELNEARTLQLALVPPPFAGMLEGHALSIELVLEPAKEVGGDIVDHFMVGPDLLVLVLGDVSDKGAGAALFMARTHSLLRGLAARPDAADLFSAPQRAVALTNEALAAGNATGMFVTLLLATLRLETGDLTYVRAGHVPPYLRRADGLIERMAAAGGPPLGLMDGVIYKQSAVRLNAGDRLLAVTDGFTEAMEPGGALLGDARIEAFVRGLSAAEAAPLPRLVAAVRAFEAGRPPSDDMAAILLTVSGEAG